MKKMKVFKSTDLNLRRSEVLDEAIKNGAVLETGSSRHGKREPIIMISQSSFERMRVNENDGI